MKMKRMLNPRLSIMTDLYRASSKITLLTIRMLETNRKTIRTLTNSISSRDIKTSSCLPSNTLSKNSRRSCSSQALIRPSTGTRCPPSSALVRMRSMLDKLVNHTSSPCTRRRSGAPSASHGCHKSQLVKKTIPTTCRPRVTIYPPRMIFSDPKQYISRNSSRAWSASLPLLTRPQWHQSRGNCSCFK